MPDLISTFPQQPCTQCTHTIRNINMAVRLLHKASTRQLARKPSASFRPSSTLKFSAAVPIMPIHTSPLENPIRFVAHTPRTLTVSSATAAGDATTAKVPFEPSSLPQVAVQTGLDAGSWGGDLLVLAVTEDDLVTENEVTSIKSERLQALDAASGGAIADCIAAGGFEGKKGQQSKAVRVGGAPGVKARQVALVGLGKADKASVVPEWGTTAWQALGSGVGVLAKAQRAVKAGVMVLDAPTGDAATAISQIATGVLQSGYESSRFKSKASPTASKLAEVHVGGPGLAAANSADATKAVHKAAAKAAGNMLTRFLVEAPPNVCTPTHLAEAAQHIATQAPETMKLTVLEKADCQALHMGLYLGVAEASEEPPKFIHLTYTAPGDGPKKKLALVGKGLTFDSGGYNLKAGPGSMIEMMKFDMGGAAATLGAARIIAALAPPNVEVHFIVAACENMVAGKGLRPGDVITSASGKTVEVNNTDAEGRLTLADALWYAQEKCGVTAVIDSATLTGACIIALGTDIAGLWTPSEDMAAAINKASKAAGEKVWRMPLEDGYWEQMKSSCADMKNTGARWGGSITAALFLKQYIKEGVEWAHLDIAGPVWDEKSNLPTGYGAALLAEWVVDQAATAASA